MERKHLTEKVKMVDWRGIITDACERLNELGMSDLRVTQVKEKFGGLRLYVRWDGGGDDREAVMDITIGAVARSWRVCEGCGAPAETRKMTTLCAKCRRVRR